MLLQTCSVTGAVFGLSGGFLDSTGLARTGLSGGAGGGVGGLGHGSGVGGARDDRLGGQCAICTVLPEPLAPEPAAEGSR